MKNKKLLKYLWYELRPILIGATLFIFLSWIFPTEKSVRIGFTVWFTLGIIFFTITEYGYYKKVIEPKEKEAKNDLSKMQ